MSFTGDRCPWCGAFEGRSLPGAVGCSSLAGHCANGKRPLWRVHVSKSPKRRPIDEHAEAVTIDETRFYGSLEAATTWARQHLWADVVGPDGALVFEHRAGEFAPS